VLTGLYFISSLALLYMGGEGLVRGAAALGMRFGLSPLVAGLTIIAFATSAPELAVSVEAALRDVPGLAVGNVVGSNICNIALVLGITALIKPPRLRETVIRRDVLFMIICTLFVPALLMDHRLSRAEGALLTIGIVCYTVLTVWHARTRRRRGITHQSKVPTWSDAISVNCVISIVSLGLLVYGSDMLVRASVEIATALGVSSAVVGLSAAALGTSLPELTTSVIAARHNEPEMAAGNLIGSNIFNLLLVLGTTSLIRPLSSNEITLIDLGVMIGVSLLALVFMITKTRVERREGAILVVIYFCYMAWLFGH